MTAPRSREHYQAVADLWLKTWSQRGGKPTLAIAAAWNVPHTTATRWVRRARQLGILTEPYKRGHVCPGCGHKIECTRGDLPTAEENQ